MTRKATRDPKRPPTHPGAIIREDILPALGRPKIEIAKLAGISRRHLNDILKEKKPVSPAVAVRLGKLFGNGPDLLIGMQVAYDTWYAERGIDVSKIPTLESAAWKKG